MPEAMADDVVKVAVVRNFAAGDHTRQFLEDCVFEGRSLGFTVDTFITEGDNERCRALIGKIAAADYDGLILSQGSGDFPWASLNPLVGRGMKVVAFDAFPLKNGEPRGEMAPGITCTFQDDEQLARISLEAILSHFAGKRPVRLIRAGAGPGVPLLDRRQAVYDELVREGKIEELALVRPQSFAFSRGGIREALAAALPRFPEGVVDAIWAPSDEFARGCADALAEAGRRDIKLVSIDTSSEAMSLMLDNTGVWLCSTTVDSGLIGTVTMRILAAKFAGEATPETYRFDAQLVESAGLAEGLNMEHIARVLLDRGREPGLFDGYSWMAELKAAGGLFPRLPPERLNAGGGPR
jgi:simple sugar transport system substrate-binding protein